MCKPIQVYISEGGCGLLFAGFVLGFAAGESGVMIIVYISRFWLIFFKDHSIKPVIVLKLIRDEVSTFSF